MSYVIAAYILTVASVLLYGGRLVVRSRQVAAALLARQQADTDGEQP